MVKKKNAIHCLWLALASTPDRVWELELLLLALRAARIATRGTDAKRSESQAPSPLQNQRCEGLRREPEGRAPSHLVMSRGKILQSFSSTDFLSFVMPGSKASFYKLHLC